MIAESFDLLTLALLPGLTPARQRELLARGPLDTALRAPEVHEDLLGPEGVTALRSGDARACARRELDEATRRGISIITTRDADYPPLLAEIADPPPALWLRGRLEPSDSVGAVAIVGRRAASGPGAVFARRLARDLAAAGVTIVSGLARGIDGEAHRGALETGRTLAALGTGVDIIYPPEHQAIASLVAAAGALLSELPLGTPPRPGHFPRRNRIIAGLAAAVVVVEAAARSGALITARLALEFGREVMAVPGHPLDPGASGTNALLRDGAVVVRDAGDVLAELGVDARESSSNAIARANEDNLLRHIGDRVVTLEALQSETSLQAGPLLARLASLELDGLVRRLPGPAFARETRR